jgi:hypothetical protein
MSPRKGTGLQPLARASARIVAASRLWDESQRQSERDGLSRESAKPSPAWALSFDGWPADFWGRGWFFAGRIPPAPSTLLVLQGRVNNFDLLLSLANGAGPSPSSLLYSQMEDQFVGLAGAARFQADRLEMALEVRGAPRALVASARLVAVSIQPGA